MENEEKMIKELRSIGIEVRLVLKAIVPQDMGTPMRNDLIREEMSIEDAYRKYCLSGMRNYDPFTAKFY